MFFFSKTYPFIHVTENISFILNFSADLSKILEKRKLKLVLEEKSDFNFLMKSELLSLIDRIER